jgi:hypothetical protein
VHEKRRGWEVFIGEGEWIRLDEYNFILQTRSSV